MSKYRNKKPAKWVFVDPNPEASDLALKMSSQESMTSQMSIPSVPHEESVLELFFQLLSQASYQRAKELVDSEKDGHKMSYASSWGDILQCLSQIAMAEKGYTNLVFLGQKRFSQIVRQKDSLKSIYSLLIQEFHRLENMLTPARMEASPSESLRSDYLLAHISGQMGFFLKARTKMIEFYEQLSSLGCMKQWVNFEDLVMMCEEILKTYMKGFHHPLLVPLKTVFSLECESLCHLLHSHIHQSSWSYLAALTQLHYAHTKLSSWQAMLPAKEVKAAFSRGASKQSSAPPLLAWLLKLKGTLLSKFGLYFYDVLAGQTLPCEMKSNLAKTPDDFVGRVQAFQKKTDASHVMLVFDCQDLPNSSREPGYVHPDRYVPAAQQGRGSFPAIFTYPPTAERPVLACHWPSILMMMTMTSGGQADCVMGRIKYAQERATDRKPLTSYFIVAVDARIHLVVVFEGKKSEKDSSVNTFMAELSAQLRCLSVLAALKQLART